MRFDRLILKFFEHGMRIIFSGLTMAAVIYLSAASAYAMDFSVIMRLGYSPHAGGSMRSGWQEDNLDVDNGLYDINRSSSAFDVSTIEAPVGAVAAFETMFSGDAFYFKTGIWGLYTIAGGKGKTVDAGDTTLYRVSYKQWSFDVPVTAGINLFYWGESHIYLGCGVAFAYGASTMSFKSSTEHKAMFAGYAFPLVAELGCEYMIGEMTSLGCGVRYLYGKTSLIEDGTDYAVVDFTGFNFSLSASVHFGRGGSL